MKKKKVMNKKRVVKKKKVMNKNKTVLLETNEVVIDAQATDIKFGKIGWILSVIPYLYILIFSYFVVQGKYDLIIKTMFYLGLLVLFLAVISLILCIIQLRRKVHWTARVGLLLSFMMIGLVILFLYLYYVLFNTVVH